MGRPLKWQGSAYMQHVVAQNRPAQQPLHWLDLQRAERYQWQQADQRTFYRRLGVVESLFDGDGEYWCGRADLHQNLRFEIRTTLSDTELRERIILAWTIMRHSHVLLSSKAKYLHEIKFQQPNERWTNKCFVYQWPRSAEQALEETRQQVTFVADRYPDVDTEDFFHHIKNTGRALNAKVALSKLYVMPFKRTPKGTIMLHLITVLAHQITDGLTAYRWNNQFSRIINLQPYDLRTALDELFLDETAMRSRLPPCQETLYPTRSQNNARERWHWLLTRILRHVRAAPSAAFQNPLRREQPLSKAKACDKTYKEVLDYSQTPPLNSGNMLVDLHGRPVQNMRKLCKDARISIGSGCFTLVAMVMMEFEERRAPDIPLSHRLPFVGSFPVNPRPFLAGEPTTGKENSCMLAFSDGVTLPFLPGDLDFATRFRVLGRLAHKQLRQYQKRKRSLAEEIHLGSRSPSQLLPALFCSTLERMEGRSEESRKAGVNVQGGYPAKLAPTMATCGISSVGDTSAVLIPLKVDLNKMDGKDLVAEFKDVWNVVRARDGECLVGAFGNRDYLGFGASYDANAIDPTKMAEWKEAMKSMLDRDLFPKQQAKL